MEIKKLQIQNYKSLVNFELVEPNPFTVFIGPNASGKSNFFEALEFVNYNANGIQKVESLFGGKENLAVFKYPSSIFSFNISFSSFKSSYKRFFINERIFGRITNNQKNFILKEEIEFQGDIKEHIQFYSNFSRLFIQNQKLVKININDDSKLNIDASNLEKVLKRILKEEGIKEELLEWLQLLIPEFDNIEVRSDNIAGTDTLLVYEKYTDRPFNKNLHGIKMDEAWLSNALGGGLPW